MRRERERIEKERDERFLSKNEKLVLEVAGQRAAGPGDRTRKRKEAQNGQSALGNWKEEVAPI